MKVFIASIAYYNTGLQSFHSTAGEQLKVVFEKNNVEVVFTPHHPSKIISLTRAIYILLKEQKKYAIAIVPLFGTRNSFLWQQALVFFLRIMKKKIILVIHGGSVPERLLTKERKKFLRAFSKADKLVAPSGFMQASLQALGLPSIVIENALPLEDYPFFPKKIFKPRLIWMRAFEETYHPFMAVEVANILCKKYKDFSMVMAGSDRGLLKSTRQLAQSYSIADKISFPGYIGLKEKLAYAQEYDIYICTNKIDNAPVSFIEFMCMGLPVVSVNTGGIPYIIEDGVNGLLVEADNAKAMADKIQALIENQALAQNITRQAWAYSRKYSEAIIFEKWMNILKSLGFKTTV